MERGRALTLRPAAEVGAGDAGHLRRLNLQRMLAVVMSQARWIERAFWPYLIALQAVPRPMDMGELDGHLFANIAACGLFGSAPEEMRDAAQYRPDHECSHPRAGAANRERRMSEDDFVTTSRVTVAPAATSPDSPILADSGIAPTRVRSVCVR